MAGLERYEWKRFETENPDPIIERMSWFGWRVHDIRKRERTIRAKHSGTSIRVEGLGSYSGTTTYDREYWVELTMVRDPVRDPNYRELVECERIWHSPEPGHRVVREAQSGTTRLGRFFLWTFGLILTLGIPHVMLKGAWDAYAELLNGGGFWYQTGIYLAFCALAALPFALLHKPRPAFAGDRPLTEDEKREWNRRGAAHNKLRYAALERAQELTGTR
ncbi:MAG: hypothetical protein WC876_07800 [Candidatus Thermoplasmatota archaeon]|jgi:hypothetical protein